MSERVDKLKEQIMMQCELREKKMKEAEEIVAMALEELTNLWHQFYFSALKGLDKGLVRTMDLEFELPDDSAWKSLYAHFNYEGVKIYRKGGIANTRIYVYDGSSEKDIWIEDTARTKAYDFVQKYPNNWREILDDQFNKALERKLELTAQELSVTPVYGLPVDEYTLKKFEKQEKKNRQNKHEKHEHKPSVAVSLDLTKEQLQQNDIKHRLACMCCDNNKEPIIVDADNLCILGDDRQSYSIEPIKIEPGMYLYERYEQYFGDIAEVRMRGLSYVEGVCFIDGRIVISTKEYIISNVDFIDEYYSEKQLRR